MHTVVRDLMRHFDLCGKLASSTIADEQHHQLQLCLQVRPVRATHVTNCEAAMPFAKWRTLHGLM